MMRKLLLLTAVTAVAVHAVYAQSQDTDSARPLKAGQVVQLSDSLTFRVTKSTKSPFTDIKVKGQAVVVVLDLDAGKKSTMISYQLSADPKLSEIYLASGAQKIAPHAVMEDFQSWGPDNDKEVEILDPTEKAAGVTLTFERKGSVSLLFDVPVDQAKTPQTFSIKLRTIKPTDEQHSFVVNL